MSSEDTVFIEDLEKSNNDKLLVAYLKKEHTASRMYIKNLINKKDYDYVINSFPLWIKLHPRLPHAPLLNV